MPVDANQIDDAELPQQRALKDRIRRALLAMPFDRKIAAY
jgi:hypothetical protein